MEELGCSVKFLKFLKFPEFLPQRNLRLALQPEPIYTPKPRWNLLIHYPPPLNLNVQDRNMTDLHSPGN